jgi:hypothetical protein
MASINIAGDTSGTITLSAPLVAGTNTLTLPASTGIIATQGVGQGQTWTDVTASRVAGTTYTNSTGRPIQINISAVFAGTTVTVGGVNIGTSSTTQRTFLSFVVPNGATYSVTALTAGFSWAELR